MSDGEYLAVDDDHMAVDDEDIGKDESKKTEYINIELASCYHFDFDENECFGDEINDLPFEPTGESVVEKLNDILKKYFKKDNTKEMKILFFRSDEKIPFGIYGMKEIYMTEIHNNDNDRYNSCMNKCVSPDTKDRNIKVIEAIFMCNDKGGVLRDENGYFVPIGVVSKEKNDIFIYNDFDYNKGQVTTGKSIFKMDEEFYKKNIKVIKENIEKNNKRKELKKFEEVDGGKRIKHKTHKRIKRKTHKRIKRKTHKRIKRKTHKRRH
jgi:hypothetical protein